MRIWGITLGPLFCFFFFFNDTATTEIYTLSLHDALPIALECDELGGGAAGHRAGPSHRRTCASGTPIDRKSTRLNSSHLVISYAVFCLKKNIKIRPMGSVAYKLALVSAGLADVTFTLTPKNEWDVVAVFFFIDRATTDINTLSKPAALPI